MLTEKKKRLEDLASEIADMDYTKFTEGDDYASLTKRYSQQGKKAMDDTIGKVAARTGGLASSYATAAGNQAYSSYMEKLEDAARAMYDDQRQEKIDNLGIYKSLYDQEYQESRDRESDSRYLLDRTSTMTADEKASLANELYYNANAYPTYADYKTAFPGTLLTEADFNQIKGTATGKYAEDNRDKPDAKEKKLKTEAEDTIMAMLKSGKTIEEIMAADSKLFDTSGRNMLYWNAYASLLEQQRGNKLPTLDIGENELLTQLESGNYSPAALNTYEQTYGESYFNKIMRDKSYEKMDAQSIYYLGETLKQMGRVEEADKLAEMWDTYKYKETMGPLKDRTWTVVDPGGKNYGGGINRNAKIRDQAGHTYKLSEFIGVLANNSFDGDREKAKDWIIEHQGEWGVNE